MATVGLPELFDVSPALLATVMALPNSEPVNIESPKRMVEFLANK
jgi:hypothetical protein